MVTLCWFSKTQDLGLNKWFHLLYFMDNSNVKVVKVEGQLT